MVGEPKFYSEDGGKVNQDDEILDLIQTVAPEDPKFVLNLAKYARNELYLRTAPQVILAECSLIPECKPFVRKAVKHIIRRPDEMATCIAYLQSRIGHLGDQQDKGSMPAALKKGIADKFTEFTEYQLQKYNNQRKQVKLIDVMRLTHPKPNDVEQSDVFKRLKTNRLATPETWETIISEEGSTDEAWKKAAKVMPYMATLRNLRNLLEHDAVSSTVTQRLIDPDKIAKSKQFPYQFYSAYRAVQEVVSFKTQEVMTCIQIALETSVHNVPELEGKTFVAADNSGSMAHALSAKSKMEMKEIANLSMAILADSNPNTMCSVFADEFMVIPMDGMDSILSNMDKATHTNVGYSTNGYLTIQYLLDNNIYVDRIILFSDMQIYDMDNWYSDLHTLHENLLEYRNKINHDVKVYSFDLSGYGTLQIPEDEKGVVHIGGWSDKVFTSRINFIKIYEQDHTSALKYIESLE